MQVAVMRADNKGLINTENGQAAYRRDQNIKDILANIHLFQILFSMFVCRPAGYHVCRPLVVALQITMYLFICGFMRK